MTIKLKHKPKGPLKGPVKTNPVKTKLGHFEKKDGAIVVRAPDDEVEPTDTTAKSDKTVVTTQKGAVTVEVAGDDKSQHAWDKDSELLAHNVTVEAREENAKRAKEAKVKVTAKKLRTGSVVTTGTIDDIDISEYDKDDHARSKAGTAEEDLVELIENDE